MKNTFARIVIAAILLFCSQSTFAQNAAPVSGQRLAAIEQEMFKDSNQNFIIVDLIMDGQLPLNSTYEFKYDNGVVYLNDKKISEKWQAKYTTRFKEFLAYTGSDATGSYRMAGGVNAQNILDPNSSFRNPVSNMIKTTAQYKKEHPQK